MARADTDYELYGRGGYEMEGVSPVGPAYSPEAEALMRALGIDLRSRGYDPADAAQIHDWQQYTGEDDEAAELTRKLASPTRLPEEEAPERTPLRNLRLGLADALMAYAAGGPSPARFLDRSKELQREQAEQKTRRKTQQALMDRAASDRSMMERLEDIRSGRKERIRAGERSEDIAREEARSRESFARADAAEATRIRERKEDQEMGLLDVAASEGVDVTDNMSRSDIRNAIARSRRERRMQEVGRGNAEKLEMADREAASAGEELFNVYLFGDQAMGVPPLSEQVKVKSPQVLAKEFDRRLAPLNIPEETRKRLVYEFQQAILEATPQERIEPQQQRGPQVNRDMMFPGTQGTMDLIQQLLGQSTKVKI